MLYILGGQMHTPSVLEYMCKPISIFLFENSN